MNVRGDFINISDYLKGGCNGEGSRLFSMVLSNRRRGNRQKVEQRNT